jgi:hypothetical protein
MTLLIAWLVFPLVLSLLCLGCGLAVERAVSIELPAPLLLPTGFALMSVVAQFAILSGSTAELATPAVVALAIAGVGLSRTRRPRAVDAWWLVAGVGVFAAFAAPVVLSGRATFAGYIKLDDTATYLAMLDRAVHHGYDTAGLASSTYEATLDTSLAYGYPLGSLLPLGVGRTLIGVDAAWLWQPYLTLLAALLALGLYQLVSGLVASPRLRALIAFVGGQAALLYGYALWGGVKELAIAALLVLGVALVPLTVSKLERVRAVLPLALACAATVGVLSVGGAGWLAPLLAAALLLALRSAGVKRTLLGSVALVVAAALFAIPSFVAAGNWLSHAGAFTGGTEYANLSRRLSWLQLFGIWPKGDFRTPPASLDTTHVLVGVVGVAAALALVLSLRRRAWELPIAVATALFGSALYVTFGSPWIGAKALASASPVVLTAALAGAGAVFEGGRRVEGVIAAGVVAAGVIWSNVLQYHQVSLAPSSRLAELATIGHDFAGQGPTLMTEFEVYGARHFLRNMDTEAAAELRRHFVHLRSGGVAGFGVSPDIDEIQLDAVLYYRTLVLRRSGVGSRPPSIYSSVWSGRYYQVWQRPEGPIPILEHLSLGSRLQPASVPPCAEVVRLARVAAANNGVLAAVERPPPIVIEPDGATGIPTSFSSSYGEDPKAVYVTKATSIEASFSTAVAGSYGIWVGGLWRASLEAWVDGKRVGSARDVRAWPTNFVELGRARLGTGAHRLRIRYSGPDLHPGSAGRPEFGLGPFAVAQVTQDRAVTYVRPSSSRSLCGKSLDWLEALRG